ncbi:MAG: putative bifunctional diguanylate cyclase/phosphodiesterase [Solirubrobacteraceae bacterium]
MTRTSPTPSRTVAPHLLLALALTLLAGLIGLQVAGVTTSGAAAIAWSVAYDLIFLVSAVACLLRGRAVADERGAWTLIATGLVLSGLGYAYDSTTTLVGATAGFPGPADLLWICLYPFLYVGILRLVKARTGRDSRVAADGALAALALCAVAAAVLVPRLLATTDADLATIVTNVIYPLADVHLLGFALWTGALGGRRLGPAWLLLLAAAAGTLVVDTVYLGQITAGTYAGGLVDLGWPTVAIAFAGLAFMPRGTSSGPMRERAGLRLAIPVVASLIATALVVREAIEEDPQLLLAALTLVAAVARAAHVSVHARRLEGQVEFKGAQLAEAQRLANAGSFEYDLVSGHVEWSDELWRIHGVARGSIDMRPGVAMRLVHPEDRNDLDIALKACIAGGGEFTAAYRIVRPGGEVRRVEMRGSVTGTLMQTSIQDVTEQRLVEDQLRRSEARHRLVFESAHEGIWILDDERRTLDLNPRMCELLGRPAAEVLGRSAVEFTDEHGREAIARGRASTNGGIGDFELKVVRPDGQSVWVAGSVSLFRDAWSSGFVVIANDVTRRRELEAGLRRAAEEDALTGLANRARFEAVVEERATRGGDYAVVLIDLDHIKLVNDSFGHAAGDELLCHAAESMASVLGDADLLARFGGDEFALLLADADPCAAIGVVEGVLRALRDSRWRGSQRVTASGGIAVAAQDRPRDMTDMLKAADIALYEAKDAGRDRCVLYHGPDGGLAWVEEVRAAIAEERMVLFSQQIVPLGDGPRREELLVRMLDRHGELLPPAAFIPVAEQFGLIGDLDLWVVRQAIELARGGRAVEVNLSGASLGEPEIVARVTEAVAEGVDPALLVFEVTETAAVRNMDHARAFAHTLAGLGCGFALDDFGTGFGSLTYLRNFPITQIKIDIEFIRDLMVDPGARKVVRSIIGIAQSFGHETVAEGVEDLAAIPMLTGMGVDFAQGFALHPPELVTRVPARGVASGTRA